MTSGGFGGSTISSQLNLLNSISRLSVASSLYALSSKANSPLSQSVLFGSNNSFNKTNPVQVGAGELAAKSKVLTDISPSGIFQKKGVEVQAEQSVDDTAVSGTANFFAENGLQLDVEVSQIAKSQTNISDTQVGAGASALAPGTYTFSITAQGETVGQSYSVTVGAGDTNKDVLESVKAEIESREGYTATVENRSGGDYRLKISGDNTGEDFSFSITDSSGNLAATLGLTNTGAVADSSTTGGVSQASQNAEFTVNGVAQESLTNSPVVSNGAVTLNIKRTTTDNVQLTVGQDQEGIKGAIEDFVEAYNEQLKNLDREKSLTNVLGSQGLRLGAFLNQESLSDIGIKVSASGELTIDETDLVAAIADDPEGVEKAFKAPNGVAAFAQAQSERTLASPLVFGGSSLSSLFSSPSSPSSLYGLNSQESLNSFNTGSQGLFLSFFA